MEVSTVFPPFELIYVVLNVAALFAYLFDKRAAVQKRERISESALLALSFLGPFGAVIGMKAFRHKTRKAKFLLVPAFLVLHLVIILFFLFGSGLGGRL